MLKLKPKTLGSMVVISISVLFCPQSAHATSTVTGYISYLSGGWVQSYVRVQLNNQPSTNVEGCTLLDGYLTDPADQGNSLFNSILLSAYMAGKKVELVLSGCTQQRPHVIAVNLIGG